MENSYRYFENRDCKYYPCHKGIEEMNCLFCFCPFYLRTDCPGRPEYIRTRDGSTIKNCTNCTFPHVPEHYDVIIEWLKKQKSVPAPGNK